MTSTHDGVGTTAGAGALGGAEPPLDDAVVAELQQVMARYPQARSALLPMLHLVQSVQGRVTSEGIETCADLLGISAAEVAGVATFYTMFKRRPVGDYLVGVCTNTLCAVLGGDAIFERLQEHLDVGNDETTEDGRISLERVECNAACDYAPVVMVNWEFMDRMDPQRAVELVDDLRAGREVRSTRGPRICTWRQAERVLAGFPDDRADDGPSAGPASLLGLRVAAEHGWQAPPGPHDDRDGHARGDTAGPGEREQAASGVDRGEQEYSGAAESSTRVEDSPAATVGRDAGGEHAGADVHEQRDQREGGA